MRKLFIILLSAISLTAFAQDKKTVAVLDPICRDNSVNPFFQQMVRGAMESAVTASTEYEAYDRSAFDMIQKEQAFQRTGAVSDAQIKKMGEMAGVDYVLVSEVSAYEGYLSAVIKILNITTGKYDKSVDDYTQMSPEAVKQKCTELASRIFGSANNQHLTVTNSLPPSNANKSSNKHDESLDICSQLLHPESIELYTIKDTWKTEQRITEECIINISIMNECVKSKKYTEAWEPWWQAFSTCPNANKAIYSRGEELLCWYYDNAKTQKERDKYLNLLMELFDRRIYYFGDDPKYPISYILGRKGIVIFKYSTSEREKVLSYLMLKECVNNQKEQSQIQVLVNFYLSSAWIYQQCPKHKSQFEEDYQKTMLFLKNHSKTKEARELGDYIHKHFENIVYGIGSL